MADKILNQAQADALYNAMCHLNNVCGRIEVSLRNCRVQEYANGSIRISTSRGRVEMYDNQSAFATAYGLQQG